MTRIVFSWKLAQSRWRSLAISNRLTNNRGVANTQTSNETEERIHLEISSFKACLRNLEETEEEFQRLGIVTTVQINDKPKWEYFAEVEEELRVLKRRVSGPNVPEE